MNIDSRLAYAKQLISQLSYLTLATTSADGQPWNTPVFCAYDGRRTFYWGSRLDAQHSKNIAKNERGFIVIYDSTVEPGRGEAIYAQVLCGELSDITELNHAIELLHERFGQKYMTVADVQSPAEQRLYKATVETA